jgi:hypothetical protein
MDQVTTALVERWILTFLEAPPLIDVELMTQVLAEYEYSRREDPP